MGIKINKVKIKEVKYFLSMYLSKIFKSGSYFFRTDVRIINPTTFYPFGEPSSASMVQNLLLRYAFWPHEPTKDKILNYE